MHPRGIPAAPQVLKRAMPEARAGPWKISAGHDQAGPKVHHVHAPAIHSTAKPAIVPRCSVAMGTQL